MSSSKGIHSTRKPEVPVSDCDLTFWADLKSRDAQGNDRTPPHYLVAFGKQLRCFSEAKCRALLSEDQPASYLHAFDWIDGLWNGQLSKQPWHVEVCTALLEHAFLKGLHACVHAKAAADEASAADALEAAKQAVQKKFGEEKRFETDADKTSELEHDWQTALQVVNAFMSDTPAKDAVSRLPHVLRLLEATLQVRFETLPPIGSTLDMHLPRYSSPLFLEAIQRDAMADLLGTVCRVPAPRCCPTLLPRDAAPRCCPALMPIDAVLTSYPLGDAVPPNLPSVPAACGATGALGCQGGGTGSGDIPAASGMSPGSD